MSKTYARAMEKLRTVLFGPLYESLKRDISHKSSRESQLVLFHMYREMAARGNAPSFRDAGFRCHSQCEEDGLLLFIFAMIGTTNKKTVEICAGDGTECMSANLILNHGWWGYLFDGNKKKVERGRRFYAKSRDTFIYPPRFTHAWINAENVNDLIAASGVTGEIDLLSLDLDGIDYWVWKAIDCINPRVVVCETHNVIGPNDPLTVPYDPNFKITVRDYHSASLAAMVKLADSKGYRLVGTNRYGFNAFFIRRDIQAPALPETTPEECLQDPYSIEARLKRWPKVKNMDWVRV